MRDVPVQLVTEAVKSMSMEATCDLGEDVTARLRQCLDLERSPLARETLGQILENAELARAERSPMCQDTGFQVVFAEIGQELRFSGGHFMEAVQEGIRQAHREGFLRASIVSDPLRRKNTGDNTPAVVHVEIMPGDGLKLSLAPKGGGSENMSEVRMLTPHAGREGVVEFVVDRVRRSGPNPCPPLVVGVGLGGTFEKCAWLAKKSLLRVLGRPNPDPFYAELEAELLDQINRLGIGPMGYGGSCTALAVHVETHPCHIASLPVAVNLQCHAARHRERVI